VKRLVLFNHSLTSRFYTLFNFTTAGGIENLEFESTENDSSLVYVSCLCSHPTLLDLNRQQRLTTAKVIHQFYSKMKGYK
jgi:hypothetical protein